MQHTLGVQEDQADKVFAVLYDNSLRLSKAEGRGNEPSDPVEAMQKEVETMQNDMAAKLQALERVLTSEQLADYRKQQELQLKLVTNTFSKLLSSPARP